MITHKKRIAVIMGTRPEAIKMAPVVHALKKRSGALEALVISTGQHRQMLDQVLSLFNITPDVDMHIMQPDQTLADLTARVLVDSRKVFAEIKPDLLLVQGDTTTVFAASLAAFYFKIRVGHIEAGLRSHDLYNPFPEELNRRLTSIVTDLYFPPTMLARNNLLQEGVRPEQIVVTGNTVIDALYSLLDRPYSLAGSPLKDIPFEGRRVLLVTSHRRESLGEDLANTCGAIKDLINRFPDLLVVYPVHLNPNVRGTVYKLLADVPRVHLLDPLDYLTFINLMQQSHLILTDSGGVQEEAPSLHKPLLVIRRVTERPEAFEAGLSRVIGNAREHIVSEVSRLLTDELAYQAMSTGVNPYGDGHASERIAKAVVNWARKKPVLLSEDNQFKPHYIHRRVSSYTGEPLI
ncbi:non-hydrolyzing UDP-N-acetylglucosamine 2-epimerase [Methylobacter sp. YRD-M1]|uniref:non-hydrolyzing UDP-N-acetylglucosamine 2-epimerase n=1 Tax=Methylobacter sp. YRD-M1 TaxID=2911520 RepID=UPI002DD69DBD|nr:UDP-N-acetylglucosamine 2-epimerase (non-hydrolyzing) [Methylobacter sp. YRD-M1]